MERELLEKLCEFYKEAISLDYAMAPVEKAMKSVGDVKPGLFRNSKDMDAASQLSARAQDLSGKVEKHFSVGAVANNPGRAAAAREGNTSTKLVDSPGQQATNRLEQETQWAAAKKKNPLLDIHNSKTPYGPPEPASAPAANLGLLPSREGNSNHWRNTKAYAKRKPGVTFAAGTAAGAIAGGTLSGMMDKNSEAEEKEESKVKEKKEHKFMKFDKKEDKHEKKANLIEKLAISDKPIIQAFKTRLETIGSLTGTSKKQLVDKTLAQSDHLRNIVDRKKRDLYEAGTTLAGAGKVVERNKLLQGEIAKGVAVTRGKLDLIHAHSPYEAFEAGKRYAVKNAEHKFIL